MSPFVSPCHRGAGTTRTLRPNFRQLSAAAAHTNVPTRMTPRRAAPDPPFCVLAGPRSNCLRFNLAHFLDRCFFANFAAGPSCTRARERMNYACFRPNSHTHPAVSRKEASTARYRSAGICLPSAGGQLALALTTMQC